jgi:hypothetical protein
MKRLRIAAVMFAVATLGAGSVNAKEKQSRALGR